MSVVEKIRQKAKESRDQFISTRSMVEREVVAFAENIASVDPALIAHIKLPKSGITPKDIFPSLYSEPVSVEKYNKERDVFAAVLMEFDKVRDKLIMEAEAMMNG
jgi:hypothetical protein